MRRDCTSERAWSSQVLFVSCRSARKARTPTPTRASKLSNGSSGSWTPASLLDTSLLEVLTESTESRKSSHWFIDDIQGRLAPYWFTWSFNAPPLSVTIVRVSILCGAPPNANDAVGDFAWLLAQQLSTTHHVSLIVPSTDDALSQANSSPVSVYPVTNGWGIHTIKEVLKLIRRVEPQVILAHFVPQLYGWYGAKPFFVILLLILWTKGYPIIAVLHEFSVPFGPSLKLMLLASIHQLFLRILLQSSRAIILTTQDRLDLFKRRFPRRAAHLHKIPIGCTIPPVPISDFTKHDMRRRLGIQPDELVLSTFASVVGSDHLLLARFFSWLIREGRPVRFLLLGKGGEVLRQRLAHDPAILGRIILTGAITNEALSQHLSLSDLYVAFYDGGASTRRTSLMVPLAHGTPTISNNGIFTDASLGSSGAVHLNSMTDESEIIALRRLCIDAQRRSQLGKHGQAFFQEHFSWGTLGQQYMDVLHKTSVG